MILGVEDLNKSRITYVFMEFSHRSIDLLLKQNGDKRVSSDAVDPLGEILEQFAGDIAEEAIALAKEDGYKTVKRKHVREALIN